MCHGEFSVLLLWKGTVACMCSQWPVRVIVFSFRAIHLQMEKKKETNPQTNKQ